MTDSNRQQAIIEKLEGSRRETLALTAELNEEQWNTIVYSEGTDWNAVEILRHVVDSEAGMTALMAQINAGGQGVPEDFDLERWNKRTVDKRQDLSPTDLEQEMIVNRERLLAFINSLDEQDWDKSGRHASLRIMSIEQICHLIADHEALHTTDIRAATT